MERGNAKTSTICITRDVTVWENVIKEAHSAHALHHKTAEAPEKRRLTDKEVNDLNTFVKEKIKETVKEYNHDMHTTSDFEDLSISSSNKSIQSIISNTSVEASDNNSCKLSHKQ
eukprot:3814177-Ditylum_brightwellii.AAC.1